MKCNESSWFHANQLKIMVYMVKKVIAGDRYALEQESWGGNLDEETEAKKLKGSDC